MNRLAIVLLAALALTGCDQILEDTQYAAGYSARKFRAVRPGMTEREVIAMLGNPLAVTTQAWTEVWSYYPANDSRSRTNHTLRSTRISFDVPSTFTEFSFAQSGVVTNVAGDYLREATIGLNREAVEAKWGKPQGVFRKPFARVYRYTKAGAGRSYKMRQVHFDTSGCVVLVVAEMYYD